MKKMIIGLLAAIALVAGVVGIGIVRAPDAHASLWGVYCWSTSGSPYVTGQGWSTTTTAAAARDCGVKMGTRRWGQVWCVKSSSAWSDSFQNYYITVTKKQDAICGYSAASFTGQGYRNWA